LYGPFPPRLFPIPDSGILNRENFNTSSLVTPVCHPAGERSNVVRWGVWCGRRSRPHHTPKNKFGNNFLVHPPCIARLRKHVSLQGRYSRELERLELIPRIAQIEDQVGDIPQFSVRQDKVILENALQFETQSLECFDYGSLVIQYLDFNQVHIPALG
jgi:hypothetical protein